MKILLTGKPGVGKSTLLQKVKNNYKGKTFGIISQELKDDFGHRIGFKAINTTGEHKMFAHMHLIHTPYIVGGKYFVDVSAIEEFVVPELQKGIQQQDALVFIDEIGRMQAFSKKFLIVVTELLQTSSNILATIVYDSEPWSIQLKTAKKIILIEVSEANRDILSEILQIVFDNVQYVSQLNIKQQKVVDDLTKRYFSLQRYIQITKLFHHAIPYVIHEKVRPVGNGYQVTGNHTVHMLTGKNGKLVCDCDLSRGRGQYIESSGECSHMQAVQLFQAT